MLGEHRLFKKGLPYEEPSHVPLLVRWPGAPVRTERGVVSSIDIAATLCAVAGATPPSADGVDLSRLLDSGTPVRDAAYIEAPGNDWDGLRTANFKYAERRSGARELYDLVADPFELVNVAGNPAYAAARTARGHPPQHAAPLRSGAQARDLGTGTAHAVPTQSRSERNRLRSRASTWVWVDDPARLVSSFGSSARS